MLYLFNTNIIPEECVARVSKINQVDAKNIFLKHNGEFISAIGHESTAGVMSMLLDSNVTVNRVHAIPEPFDEAISLKLNGRIMEGSILSLEEIEKIGYTLYQIQFYPTTATISV